MQITTVGTDLAKHVFQIHGVDADGGVVVRRKLRRSEAISFFCKAVADVNWDGIVRKAHHRARELARWAVAFAPFLRPVSNPS